MLTFKRNPESIQEITQTHANLWGVNDQLELIGNVENCVFKNEGETHILRATEEIHRSREDILAEFDFIRAVCEAGVQTTRVVENSDGETLLTLDHQGSPLHIACFEYCSGSAYRWDQHGTPEHFDKLGRSLAKMHLAAETYSPPADIKKREKWIEIDYVSQSDALLPQDDHRGRRAWDAMMAWYRSLPAEEYGLIHSDTHFGNYFIDDDLEPIFFDFDDAKFSYFAFDLMIPLYYTKGGTTSPPADDYNRVRDALIDGYLAVRQLGDEWIQRINQFGHLRDMEMYVWLHMMLDMENLGERDRDYFQTLRGRFENPLQLVP